MGVTPAAFAHLTHKVMSLAQGRVAVILEVTSVILFLNDTYSYCTCLCVLCLDLFYLDIYVNMYILQGGYCLKSLTESAAMTLRTLLGDPCPRIPPSQEPCDRYKCTQILQDYIIKTAYYSIFSQLLFIINFGVAEV